MATFTFLFCNSINLQMSVKSDLGVENPVVRGGDPGPESKEICLSATLWSGYTLLCFQASDSSMQSSEVEEFTQALLWSEVSGPEAHFIVKLSPTCSIC